MAGLIEELKRRNVFKVGAAYVVLAWLLAQAAQLAAETFGAPDWVMKMLVTLLVLGFAAGAVLCLGLRTYARRPEERKRTSTQPVDNASDRAQA